MHGWGQPVGSCAEAPLQGSLARTDPREGGPPAWHSQGSMSLPVHRLSRGGIPRAPWRGPCTSAQGAGSADVSPRGGPPARASERESAEGPASQVTIHAKSTRMDIAWRASPLLV